MAATSHLLPDMVGVIRGTTIQFSTFLKDITSAVGYFNHLHHYLLVRQLAILHL
jgi:hypothetical protein